MNIRQDFEELPPKAFLMQVMDKLSKLYCFLWERKGQKNFVDMTWDELSHYYNKNNFMTSLRELCNKGLLNYAKSESGVSIELVRWDELME